MVAFIFIVSFILHIIAICAIYLLFKQIQQLKQESPNDIPALLEAYLQEIKEENSWLQNELAAASPNNLKHTETDTIIDETTKKAIKNDDTFTLPEIEVKDHVEASLQAKVLQLHYQGFSATEIAQKLNCGKTEAELIIKVHA